MGPLISLFWTSGDVWSWFQSQGGSLFACFLTCVTLRFTSGVTSADCTEVSMAAKQALVEIKCCELPLSAFVGINYFIVVDSA